MAVGTALLDTSVVIALARGELNASDVQESPKAVVVSAVTVAGLHHGVLVASPAVLAQRLHTLRFVEETCEVLPVDTPVAVHYGRIAADVRRMLGRRIGLGDGLIAATAMTHGLPLYTRDGDLEGIPGVQSVRI
ncbi:MAG TPA: PIN domain-containing protein [Conexibacter sp.]|nr:PIN domain-containing protein [Conexibacter sp.]